MGKSKAGKSCGNVSGGVHSNVSKSLRRAMRQDYLASGDQIINQLNALRAGKDIVVTMENPNKGDTSRRFIRRRISGKEYNDYIKKNSYRMKGEAPE